MKNQQYDLIIVGSGPAGLTAAIYATRRKIKTLVLAMTTGGQMALTNDIENYPGFDFIDGLSLATKMKEQATRWGAEFATDEVKKIEKSKTDFKVIAGQAQYTAKSVILAFGLTPKKLNVPGEDEFKGRGVSYCATCDGPLFKNKTIAIVGGGNSAMESAEYLAKVANQVYLINRTDQFKADAYLLEQVRKTKNIKIYCQSAITEIKGDKKVKSIILTNVEDSSKQEELILDGVFVEIGYQAKTDWLKGTVDLNARGEIVTDKNGVSSVAGIFAAGDCSDIGYKQIVIAAGSGAKTALEAYKYLASKDGKIAAPDWGKCELVGTAKTGKIKLED